MFEAVSSPYLAPFDGSFERDALSTEPPADAPGSGAGEHALAGQRDAGSAGHHRRVPEEKAQLKKAGIDFDAELEKELTELAERMKGTAVAHASQHYHEVRVTPAELTPALAAFFSIVR